MIYITGDKHGEYQKVFEFCQKYDTSSDDVMIALGDTGINYYDDERGKTLKEQLSKCHITFFCIHGNHENRPQNISTYKIAMFHGGIVFYEEEYPNILFAKDAQIYDFNGYKVMAIGGAYSVDKYFRLLHNFNWWSDEQPSDEVKREALRNIKDRHIDVLLTHTCPKKYIPYEAFIEGVNQSNIDFTTEEWLDQFTNLKLKKWYCGHYHIDKKIDYMRFMFNDIEGFIK